MALSFSREFRRIYAEKVLELANLGGGALIFTQFLTEDGFSWSTTVSGMAVLVVGFLVAYFVYHQGGERKT